MTKKNAETLTEICDIIAGGTLSYAKAARTAGVSVSSFWSWIKASRSQKGDEAFIITYLEEDTQFAKAVNVARRLALHEMRGRMEEKSIFGYDEPVFYMGQPTWQPDPRCVGLDEEMRELLGLPKDGLLRDKYGNCIQNTIHHEPPVALQLRVAEMAFPKEYRPGTTSEVNISGGAAIGVQVVKSPDYSRPPAIPPAPPLPQLEVMDAPDQTQITEIADEEPEEVVYPTEPEEPEQFQPQPFTRAPEPEQVIRELPPEEYTPPTQTGVLAPTNSERSGRPLSPLELDLLRRARGTMEERTKPIGMR